MADGEVRSYPVSAGNPEAQVGTYVLAHTGGFASFASHIALFAMRVLGQCSEYSEKPWCPHHFILFFYSDLTAAFTCSVPAHLMDGWPFEPAYMTRVVDAFGITTGSLRCSTQARWDRNASTECHGGASAIKRWRLPRNPLGC